MTIFTVFFQMLALLIMIGAGYFMTRKGMMDEHTNTQMSKMIVNVFNPMLILSSAANSAGLVSLGTIGTVGLIALGMFAIFIAAGMILSPLFDKAPDQRKIFQMMFVFSNLGFIGIPVVSSILGEAYVVYVTEFLLIYTIVFYTYGVALMDGKFSISSLKSMINHCMQYTAAGFHQDCHYLPGKCDLPHGAGCRGFYAGPFRPEADFLPAQAVCLLGSQASGSAAIDAASVKTGHTGCRITLRMHDHVRHAYRKYAADSGESERD